MRKLTADRRRILSAAALAAALAFAAGAAAGFAQEKQAPATPLQVTVERLGAFCYAGDPVLVRTAVFNTGQTAWDNARGLDLVAHLTAAATTGDKPLARKVGAASDPKSLPAVIPAGGFYGLVTDLRTVFDGLDRPGQYSVRFQKDDLVSEAILLVVIPRYDPAAAYQATVETDYGRLVFDLLGREAPKHVHNFYDLANQGYYDGSYFHVIVKGIELRGGDTTGSGSGGPGYGLPLELSPGLKLERGTLTMVRGEASDHGSQFLITLAPNPQADGMLSIFGKLSAGEETLAALENLPTSGRKDYPFYRPLTEVRIRSLRVAAAPAGSAATAESGAKAPSGL